MRPLHFRPLSADPIYTPLYTPYRPHFTAVAAVAWPTANCLAACSLTQNVCVRLPHATLPHADAVGPVRSDTSPHHARHAGSHDERPRLGGAHGAGMHLPSARFSFSPATVLYLTATPRLPDVGLLGCAAYPRAHSLHQCRHHRHIAANLQPDSDTQVSCWSVDKTNNYNFCIATLCVARPCHTQLAGRQGPGQRRGAGVAPRAVGARRVRGRACVRHRPHCAGA